MFVYPDAYLEAVLKLYLELPETPSRAGPYDRKTAIDLYQRRIALFIVEGAMLLASLRRLGRPTDYPSLSPIRSLAYFKPTIEELLGSPIPDGYLDYLRRKVRILGEVKRIKNAANRHLSRKVRFPMIGNRGSASADAPTSG